MPSGLGGDRPDLAETRPDLGFSLILAVHRSCVRPKRQLGSCALGEEKERSLLTILLILLAWQQRKNERSFYETGIDQWEI
jgi:hypothetical protein